MSLRFTTTFAELARSGTLTNIPVDDLGRRHRILAGKSARLLRYGDVVAQRDLSHGPGFDTVLSVRPDREDARFVFVTTARLRIWRIPASRLLLVHAPYPSAGRKARPVVSAVPAAV